MFFERMRKEVILSPKDPLLKAKWEQWHAHGKQNLNSLIDVSYTSNTIIIGRSNCQLFYLKIQIQVKSSSVYKVASSTESKSYTVTISPNRCTQRQCIPQCKEYTSVTILLNVHVQTILMSIFASTHTRYTSHI